MQAGAAPDPQPVQAQSFKQRIVKGFFVRMHMSLILTAVTISGVVASKVLLELGIVSLRFRYPLAVLCSYGVFLGLVRIWISYVCRARAGSSGDYVVSNLDPRSMQGGSTHSGPCSSSGSTWSLPDFGDDGGAVLLLLIALVAGIVLAGGYLIYIAPQILPEAAWQAVLASALARVQKDDDHNWMNGVLRATVIPFLIVMLLASAVGWAAHKKCPQAVKLVEVFTCKSE